MKRFGVIFDCDGTLVDSLGYALDSFNYALEKIQESPRTIDEIKKFFGASADRIFLNLLQDQIKAAQAFDHYFEHQAELAKKMVLFPGILEVLEQFKSRGVPMAVVTGRHEKDMHAVLSVHKLQEYFVTLVADNQLTRSKPNPEGIILAASRMGLDPKQTYYVGDSVTDMQAAKSAGARSVAALWDPLASKQAMQKEQPDILAAQPLELLLLKDI